MKKFTFLLWMCLPFLSACTPFNSLLYQPLQTPIDWLNHQPFRVISIGDGAFILMQPSSTFFVYLLGFLTIGFGLFFMNKTNKQKSKQWWGVALLLWGIGALLAGTSYQAFSYEIKCAGKEFCLWTSWWEIFYMIFSVASVNAMIVAVSYASAIGKLRKSLTVYAIVNFTFYTFIIMIGSFLPVKFLISFELMLLFLAPGIIFLFGLNLRRYLKYKLALERSLSITWVWLGSTLVIYFLYLMLDVTPFLWAQGIWFSENDVLHIGLITWMLYITFGLGKTIQDRPVQGLKIEQQDNLFSEKNTV
ncbi:MAG: hypothetical protein CL609_11785 [Anaerolineaceae bacterium]|nr:hypothetical protein [Anaerolineaceae bacterium]